MLDGRASHLIVAAAYGGCAHFFMTEELIPEPHVNFAMDTPPYVLAARSCRCQLPDSVRIATHPAPEEVIDQLLPTVAPPLGWYKAIFALSTAQAARMVAEGEVEVALTTEDARRRYGLVAISREKVIPMFWLVFRKAP